LRFKPNYSRIFRSFEPTKLSKFTNFKANADFLIARLIEISEIYEPNEKLKIIKDEPYNRFLELAAISKADFIITGNTNDFSIKIYNKTKAVQYYFNHIESTVKKTETKKHEKL